MKAYGLSMFVWMCILGYSAFVILSAFIVNEMESPN